MNQPSHPSSLSFALEQFDRLPDSARVDVRTVAGLLGISVPTVWRHVRTGKLPLPRKIGGSTRWLVGELRNALGDHAA
ncbi:helix-turn-helix domain-containing protein [Paraburkholderia sp. Ac-20342]|uniref:helix-turn-helix transcriptional regulator n=1 Tax=Paraburkholderia sp. Ac-20342 TaxID=2703889 RepID=UPI0019816A29|nr:helix-turn-helix domain-containing protein [Paraburkholderia sp. Ac-20342]MBN3848722.1 helix-turn-helix domain-containing protein [Paraburkholderia sp. Ac-20342]